jgi:alpha-tubulin suppressor-like RCC1 family protein
MTNLYKKSITKIVGEASNKHSMAVLTTDGTVLAWGRMIYDQYTKAIPTPFPAIPNKLVVDIAIVPRTYITTVFLTSDGLVYTRGEHNSGNDDAYIQETKIVPQMLIGERVVEVAGSGYGAIYASTNYGRILGWSSTYVTTLAKDSIRGSLGWRFGPNRPIVVLNEKDLQLNSTLAPMIAQKGYGSNEGSVWINGPSGSFGGFVTFGSCTGTLHDPMLQDIRALPWTSQVDHMIRLGYTTVAPGSNKRDVVYAGGSVQASNQCLQSSQIYGVGTNQQYQMLRGVETPTRNYFLTVTKANMANLGGGTQTLAELRGGTGFVVARTTSGALYAWGSTTFNTLANGMTTPAQGMVVTAQKIPISAQVSQVVCGDVHCIALTSTAALFSWGSNVYGQLGIGSVGGNSGVSAVTRGALGTKRVVQIAAGHIASYAITEDGYIYAWGGNTNRQLANSDLPTTGTASMQSSPATIKYYHKLLFFDSIIGESPVKMGSGAISTYVMMASGQIYSWGTATTSNIEIFRIDQTALGGRFIVDISVGAYQCLAMTSDGEMFATGTNNVSRSCSY